MKTILAVLFLCLSAQSAEYVFSEGSPKPFPVPKILGISDEQFQSDWQIRIEAAKKCRPHWNENLQAFEIRIIPPQYPGFECIIWNSGAVVYKRKP